MKALTAAGRPHRTAALALLVAAAAWGTPVAAQGAFQTLDPFYQDESARRDFFGGIAVSGEVGYRTPSLLQPASEGQTAPGALALSAQLDYALHPQVDLSAIVDLSGGVGRGPVGLSWVVVKPYWHNDNTDYAIRIAIDPASEGSLGFRQTDVAFLSTASLSPTLTHDLAFGFRHVRTGYEQRPFDGEDGGDPVSQLIADGERVRVIGKELHGAWGYNVLFDPAGSRVTFLLLAEAGDYTLLTAASPLVTGETQARGQGEEEERVRGGSGWFRAGFEFSRPSYQLAPYVTIPLVTWADVRGEPVRHGPRPDRARFGVRVTLR
ncbi:MAG TPA: hypothetical protein VK002_10450 [Rubricoccaceae bacterium]|nr:hypothetical protein [Rubricoccaceae bacterium]